MSLRALLLCCYRRLKMTNNQYYLNISGTLYGMLLCGAIGKPPMSQLTSIRSTRAQAAQLHLVRCCAASWAASGSSLGAVSRLHHFAPHHTTRSALAL